MKTLKKTTLFILVCFTALNIKAQKNNSNNNYIEARIKALLNDKSTKDYSVSAYIDGVKIDSIYNNSKRALYLDFEYNKIYSLRFQKKHCMDKVVIVNTSIPFGINALEDEIRCFEIEMTDNLLKGTNETTDFPVAILVIDKTEKLLVVCETYHTFMHHESDLYNVKNKESILTTNNY